MDGNFQWQKHRASEYHAARLREAQNHRQLKEISPQQLREELPDDRFSLLRLLARLFNRESRQANSQGRLQRPQTADRSP